MLIFMASELKIRKNGFNVYQTQTLILENAKRLIFSILHPFKPAVDVEIELVYHLSFFKFDAVDVPVKKQLLPIYLQRPFPVDVLIFLSDII